MGEDNHPKAKCDTGGKSKRSDAWIEIGWIWAA